MKRRILFLLPLLLLLSLLFFFKQGLKQDPRLLNSTLIKHPAPHFSLAELTSHKIITEKIFLHQQTLLNVWASWCESCLAEQAYLRSLHQRFPKLQIIGLNYKDTPEHAKKWLKQNGNPYQLILEDTNGTTGIDYGVYGTPETFLIDDQGQIQAKQIGILNETDFTQKLLPKIPVAWTAESEIKDTAS